MRKTKIVCTIGPASSSDEIFEAMCHAGLNVARLNFSHGTHAEHQEKIDMIKRVRERLKLPIAIMLDTKGPEYRIKTFKKEKVTVTTGDIFTFTTEDVEGDETRVSVNYAGLAAEEIILGEKEYFVMGDNCNNSEDSRVASVGNIERDNMIGKVQLRLYRKKG